MTVFPFILVVCIFVLYKIVKKYSWQAVKIKKAQKHFGTFRAIPI